MFCEKCGTYVNDNSRVCPQCGSPVKGEEQNITSNTTYKGALGNPTPVLVWGIVGLAFSLTFYLSFLGIIFSAVGLKKANSYYAFTEYMPSNQARIGKRLSVAGMIVGIILTVVLVILIIGLLAAAGNSRYYY